MKHLIWFAFFNLAFSQTVFANEPPQYISICYEDKHVPPFYTGTGQKKPTTAPGGTIEYLLQLEQGIEKVSFNLIRRPWRRCLELLAQNKVDSLIASYHPTRAKIARYPQKNNQLDESKALSYSAKCFIGTKEFADGWRNHHLQGLAKKSVAVPNGYGLAEKLAQESINAYAVESQQDAIKMLNNHRVDAILETCQLNGKPSFVNHTLRQDVTAIYPPFDKSAGYLVFSHQFYRNYHALAEKIWQQVANKDTQAVYQRYLSAN